MIYFSFCRKATSDLERAQFWFAELTVSVRKSDQKCAGGASHLPMSVSRVRDIPGTASSAFWRCLQPSAAIHYGQCSTRVSDTEARTGHKPSCQIALNCRKQFPYGMYTCQAMMARRMPEVLIREVFRHSVSHGSQILDGNRLSTIDSVWQEGLCPFRTCVTPTGIDHWPGWMAVKVS